MAARQPPTLYLSRGACSLGPHSVLAHAGIPYKFVVMKQSPNGNSTNSRYEGADGSLSHEQFLAINPKGFVPTLVVGDGPDAVVITETPAVLTYIALLVPDLNLLGTGIIDRAKVAEWLAWGSNTIQNNGFAAFWRPGRFADDSDEATMQNIKRRGREVIVKAFATIEEKLEGKEFAVGDALTVVDFLLLVYWWWWSDEEPDRKTKFPNFARLMEKVRELDGVKKAIAAEDIKVEL